MEVFHDITKIIIMEVSTSMTIIACHRSAFVKGDRHVASTVTERRQAIGSGFGSDNPLIALTNGDFPRVKSSLAGGDTCQVHTGIGVTHPMGETRL